MVGNRIVSNVSVCGDRRVKPGDDEEGESEPSSSHNHARARPGHRHERRPIETKKGRPCERPFREMRLEAVSKSSSALRSRKGDDPLGASSRHSELTRHRITSFHC